VWGWDRAGERDTRLVWRGRRPGPETPRRRLAARGCGPVGATAALAAAICLSAGGVTRAEPSRLNGFSLEPAAIPVAEIQSGGPPRDGIPALDHPEAISAREAVWDDAEIVLGVVSNGAARAYPVAILTWHELVNDTVGGRSILVSYCPLCGTGIVFDREVEGRKQTFGVSGLLYRSGLLMYDRETESLWSQISAQAVTGPSLGRRLELVRSTMDRWGTWKKAHPETTVLTRNTGHRMDYDRSPYGDYAVSGRLVFPAPLDGRYHPKMPTVGLRRPGGGVRAYPAVEVERAGGVAAEIFEGRPVRVAYDAESEVFRVDAPPEVEVVEGYWFAWAAFHPDTTVFTAGAGPAGPAIERGASTDREKESP